MRLLIPTLLVQLATPSLTAKTACSDLAALKLPDTTITSAGTVVDEPVPHCRVQGVITPVPDSHIEFEVWLPLSQWNGRYIGAGNGGYSGSINEDRLVEAVRDGSVGSATDVGHKNADTRWWEGHPERVIDFDHRAIHETAVVTKAIIEAFYGRAQSHAYFISCSNGGRQAIVEALRYPEDYDGILAGAPAYAFGAELSPYPLSAASAPDFSAFKQRGGKLLLYHGGNDQPEASVDFYRRVVALMGHKAVHDFMRLYIVPGMGHCGGGGGPEPNDIGERLRPGQDPQHSVVRALQSWVETGVAPNAILATNSGATRTRPIRPYPHELASR